MSPPPVVHFLQRLIRTESLPGEEEAIARLVAAEMEALGYDEVRIDEAGNVLGLVRGTGDAPAVMFNTHLDHVDAGDPADWAHPPFGGDVDGGRVWGRGAVDIKGPLAAQVHGVGRLAAGDGPPPGDVWVTAVVQEEVGGLGALHLCDDLPASLVVVGEPSRNELRRGHRGRVELCVRIRGRSAHASAPDRGANPLFALGAFLGAIEALDLPSHPDLGTATVVPTLLATDQRSANVIPGEARITLDCRTVPGQTWESLREMLAPVLERSVSGEIEGTIEVPRASPRSWSGLERAYAAEHPSYALEADHPALRAAGRVLARVLGEPPRIATWRFATDGGHFARAGATVIGFGPGDEALAHTVREAIEIEALEEAAEANAALGRGWAAALEEG